MPTKTRLSLLECQVRRWPKTPAAGVVVRLMRTNKTHSESADLSKRGLLSRLHSLNMYRIDILSTSSAKNTYQMHCKGLLNARQQRLRSTRRRKFFASFRPSERGNLSSKITAGRQKKISTSTKYTCLVRFVPCRFLPSFSNPHQIVV